MGQRRKQDVSAASSISFDGSAGKEINTWIRVQWSLSNHESVLLKNKGVNGLGVAGTLYWFLSNDDTCTLDASSEQVDVLPPNSAAPLSGLSTDINLFLQADKLGLQAHIKEVDSEHSSKYDTP